MNKVSKDNNFHCLCHNKTLRLLCKRALKKVPEFMVLAILYM